MFFVNAVSETHLSLHYLWLAGPGGCRFVKWVRCGGGHTVLCLSPPEEPGEQEAPIEWASEQKLGTPCLTPRQEAKLSEGVAGV